MDQARYFRQTRDAALSVSVALPAAGATANTPALDLGCAEPGSITEEFDVLLEVPATPSLVNAKNLSAVIQDSDDGQNWANVTSTGSPAATGAGGNGGAGVSQRLKLASTVRRFIRTSFTVDAAGGDNTAVSATMSLVF